MSTFIDWFKDRGLRRDGARRHFHRLYRTAAWFELRKRGTYELENSSEEPGVLGAGADRRICDRSGVQRSDRCGYDHVVRTVERYYRRVQQSVLPVPGGKQYLECAE